MEAKSKAGGKSRTLPPLRFSLLSAVVGMMAGLGAVVFRELIALIHNLLFLGKWSVNYNANLHTPVSPWGPLVILAPVAGAVGVAFLVKTFAPEAKGHGVPEVMDAIYYNRGRIRPVVALVKSLASALSIGSGGSVGREGPIIQIGSSFGSTIGQFLDVPLWQRIALISGGAGGGIAATFNTPVGGVLFVIEMMMHEVSVRTLVPVAIAVASAAYVGRLFFGTHPSFVIPAFATPSYHATKPQLLVAYAVLGALMGIVSALYIKSIYGAEDFFTQRVRGSYYRQHLLGMLAVGLMMYGFMTVSGHYYIQGVGYATVQDVLLGAPMSIFLLCLLFSTKLLATALTLGSGASGGIFSPALFMGATLGGAYGALLNNIFPHLNISPPAFAVAGMAGVVGGATGAAMTAIVMLFEMTMDYNVVVPMTITVAISYGVRKVFSRDSIYTMKLARRGHYLPEALQTSPLSFRRANELCGLKFTAIDASATLEEFAKLVAKTPAATLFLVKDGERVVGSICSTEALRILQSSKDTVTVADVADRNFITVKEEISLAGVAEGMQNGGAKVAVLVDTAGRITGLISRQQLADAVVEASELFRD